MLDDFLHIDDGHTLITAATVGVGLEDWISLETETASTEAGLQLMRQYQLDVVPIVAPDGNAYEYYSTLQPRQYTEARKFPISYKDTLPSNTHIKDVIRSFILNKRSFYFLRNRGEICGIITLADLNNRQVKTYLYGLLCDLETDISLFVKKSIPEQDVVDYLEEAASAGSDHKRRKGAEVLSRYYRDAEDDMRIHITEYLYLSHYFYLIEDKGLFDRPLKYNQQHWKDISRGINQIRNIVAHPAQPLIQHPGELQQVWEQLESIYDLDFRLRHWSSTQLKQV
ncbi:hypothetical protein [Cesiribacter sp. SM1]|uniref:hypothetical protein n=1 Tax=Cesiribacter sp. SM1 TaxID=2861196 RepID=UPI001CD62125|nr:hypothetical protein [Cesiribacter sp. SM1]